MGFLDQFKSDKDKTATGSWKTLDSMDQLDEIYRDSYSKPVVIFKHSTSCGISGMAKHNLESQWDLSEEEMDFYYLDLLSNRSVSNKVAAMTGITHQSPQIIVIKEGEAVYDTSHHAISVQAVRDGITG